MIKKRPICKHESWYFSLFFSSACQKTDEFLRCILCLSQSDIFFLAFKWANIGTQINKQTNKQWWIFSWTHERRLSLNCLLGAKLNIYKNWPARPFYHQRGNSVKTIVLFFRCKQTQIDRSNQITTVYSRTLRSGQCVCIHIWCDIEHKLQLKYVTCATSHEMLGNYSPKTRNFQLIVVTGSPNGASWEQFWFDPVLQINYNCVETKNII